MRLNATISGAAPPPRVSTMGTTMVATSVATRGAVHGAFTMARVVPSKAHDTKATTQAVSSKLACVRAQAVSSKLHMSEPKPRIRMHHALSSPLPTSSPLPWSSLL
ncbi:hypothetical protein ACFX19_042982 [Malus domestica]